MNVRSNAAELAAERTRQDEEQAELQRTQFEARIARDTEEGPAWILENLGVQAEATGRIQQKDSFNPGGVVFKLVDDEGYPLADSLSGRQVANPEHREKLSCAVYVNDTENTGRPPYLVMSLYAPDEEKFAGTRDVDDAIGLWNTLNTTLHYRNPSRISITGKRFLDPLEVRDPRYVARTPNKIETIATT